MLGRYDAARPRSFIASQPRGCPESAEVTKVQDEPTTLGQQRSGDMVTDRVPLARNPAVNARIDLLVTGTLPTHSIGGGGVAPSNWVPHTFECSKPAASWSPRAELGPQHQARNRPLANRPA